MIKDLEINCLILRGVGVSLSVVNFVLYWVKYSRTRVKYLNGQKGSICLDFNSLLHKVKLQTLNSSLSAFCKASWS